MRRDQRISRRAMLRRIGGIAACVPLSEIAGCAAPFASSPAADSDAGAGAWATGGTAAMTAKARYPNPFASGAPSSCPLMGLLGDGPCYDAHAEAIRDISYGLDGLPMRLVLQVLDASCRPIAGAPVNVWHGSPSGKYSGDDAAHMQVSLCTGNDAAFASHLWFRGVQTTDAAGVVVFDSCFPGWYPSRTIHVHFKIDVGGGSFSSQLLFDDALDDAILATQPIYRDRGARDTRNTTDTLFAASDVASHVFETQRMTDGAMLAWKSVVLSV